jgi:DTW domain-containing protein YfiP
MSGALCLCAELISIDTQTSVTVVMHYGEARTSSNTGRLAHHLLSRSQIVIRGEAGNPISRADLSQPDTDAYVLFPSAEAIEITPEWAASLKRPAHLIVPDGNWNQAKKVLKREPALAGAIPVKLPPGPPSRYRLREAPRAEAVCTLEAIARALALLEGPERGPLVESHLMAAFDKMVERVLWSRGHLKTHEAKTGIPPEAVEARQKSGFPSKKLETT